METLVFPFTRWFNAGSRRTRGAMHCDWERSGSRLIDARTHLAEACLSAVAL